MFISTAYAQDAAAAAGGAGAFAMQLAPLFLIFIVFYFLLIRPQQKRAKEHRQMLAGLKRNDRIITAGGILGTITKVKDGSEEVEVEIAPNVRVVVVRSTISTLVRPVAANDSKPA